MNFENIYNTIKEAKKAFNQAKTEEEKTAARETGDSGFNRLRAPLLGTFTLAQFRRR